MNEVCPICNNPLTDGADVCSHCGYKLLGATQGFKPLTVDNGSVVPHTASAKDAELKIIRGPQTGLAITMKAGQMTVGRNPQCDIFLNDMTVSRQHAIIDKTEGGWTIEDTNSYNGVWVNNVSITKHQLVSGDVIQIGAFCLTYQELE